jgi:FixJ family two-component response regulator
MMENSLWFQYHPETTLHETLCGIYGCEVSQLPSDENELYAVLKRHLTKKELKLFIMREAGMDASAIAEKLNMNSDDYEQARHKTYSKIKGNKISKEVHLIPN